MGWLKSFLAGLGAALAALGAWWQAKQRANALAEAQADADRIGADPAGEWVRRFNAECSKASQANPGKPDAK